MNEELSDFLHNNWALFWFAAGIIFLIFGGIYAFENNGDKCLPCYAFCIACHARCEIKILQRRMERKLCMTNCSTTER